MAHSSDHDHPEFLQHHFHTSAQQRSASKFGMWVFIAQELLFFSGLFMAYATMRFFYPETFLAAHEYLSVPLGSLNTVVLITSSVTMALAVRAAQVGDKKWLINWLLATIILAMVFLANRVCIRWKRVPGPAAYLAVGACVAIHAAVPTATLLEADPGLRLVLAILVLFSPIFFAGMAFSSSFRSIEKPHVSFGSNLLGAMVGGGLEYAAMVFGFGLLDGLAVGLYGLAFLSHVRSRR